MSDDHEGIGEIPYPEDRVLSNRNSMLNSDEIVAAQTTLDQIEREEKLGEKRYDATELMVSNAHLTPISPVQPGETPGGFIEDSGADME